MSFGMADVFIEKQSKPTDKDIVKAWELCFAEKGTKQTCGKCPYHKFGELCKVKRGRDTLDLINRLQAENKRLLNNKCGDCAGCTQWLCDCSNERTQAIKEYKEKLIFEIMNTPTQKPQYKEALSYFDGARNRQSQIIDIINGFEEKEMAGDKL